MIRLIFPAIAMLLATGCANGNADAAGDDGRPTDQFTTTPIVLAPSEERYVCWSIVLDSPLAVVGLEPHLSPLALHHYAVFASDEPAPPTMTAYDCGSVGAAHGIFSGEGHGEPTLAFPAGVALPLPRGQHVVLQEHLLNTSTSDVTVPAASMSLRTVSGPYLAAAMMSVTSGSFVVPARSRATVTGETPAPMGATRLFAVFPQMRDLGTHVTLAVARGGVLVDASFSAADPVVFPVAADLRAGDAISLTCDFVNPSDRTVASGATSDQETCAASLFSYEPN